MRRGFYLVFVVSIALILRFYPGFLSGLPFSTDAWGPIRNAELLMKYTPIPIGDDKIFDGYNNYWPANSIFGVIFSYVAGLRLMNAMALSIPLAGALTVLIFYVLVEKISGSSQVAFLSSLLLSVAYPYVLFMAGVTKETYANPLYVLVILLFLNGKKWSDALLFAIASMGLVMSHHLTALITIGILVSVTVAREIFRVKRGLEFDKFSVLFVFLLLFITVMYFNLYASKGLKVTVTSSDVLSILSYQIISFISALYFVFKPASHSLKRTVFSCVLGVFLVLFIFFLTTERSIVPGAPKLPGYYLLYAAPFIFISPLMVLGFGMIKGMKDERYVLPLFWFSVLLGLEGYAIFGNSPLGLVLAYRVLNFLWLPLIIISTLGLYRLLAINNLGKISKLAMSLVMIFVVLLNSYDFYASVSLQERYLGYFWLYTQPEYAASKWITAVTNQTIVGDVKISYLLSGYFNAQTNPIQGLQYLAGSASNIKHMILFIYDQMLRNGYVIYGGYSVDMSKDWVEKVNSLNLVYSNGQVKVYNG